MTSAAIHSSLTRATESGGAMPKAASTRWVLASAMIGSIIEWYDFYIFGTAAALVFGKAYFPSTNSTLSTLAALSTLAVGLFARPIGAAVFGHFGDRIGRKKMLMLSLFMMGIPTALIGLLPTYASIGIAAPILLVALRIVQGLAIGGEWGGAVLLAVEHASGPRRALYGSFPQMGIPGGVILSIGAFALASLLPEADFQSWGWRLPFLFSVLLVVFGYFARRKIGESPDFEEAKSKGRVHRSPSLALFRLAPKSLLLTIGIKAGEVTLFYSITVFLLSYLTKLGMSRGSVLNTVLIGAGVALVMMPISGMLGDRIGARRLYQIGAALLALGAIPLFMMLQTANPTLVTIGIIGSIGLIFPLMLGPQAEMCAGQFPPELRYSGMSIGIGLASAIAGGLAPIVATSLVAAWGSAVPMGFYLCLMALISLVSCSLMRVRTSNSLV
jgi:MHS family shikimate/dehydroshikimate transporter-like MFS transporter